MASGSEQKRQIQRTWGTGGYPDVGRHFLPVIARLLEAVSLTPDDRVLDVACGNGNVALTAARRGASVVGVDLTPTMLRLAQENAGIGDLPAITWCVGDAEALPVADGAVDVVVSNVGHVLAPDQTAAGAELTRVVRPGGRIGFTAWTPSSPIPTIVRTLGNYLSASHEGATPAAWSDPAAIRERLGEPVRDLSVEPGWATVPALTPAHFWAFMREYSGSLQAAFEQIDTVERPAARQAVIEALEPSFDETANLMTLDYRLTTATRR